MIDDLLLSDDEWRDELFADWMLEAERQQQRRIRRRNLLVLCATLVAVCVTVWGLR